MSLIKKLFFVLLLCNFSFGKTIDINFKNMDINELINISSKILKKNILVLEEIKGKVNYISSSSIEEKEIKNILYFVLEAKGYTLLENKNIIRVVKLKSKKNRSVKSSSLYKNKKSLGKQYFLIKELKNIEAKNLEKILKSLSLKDKTSMSIDESNNSIILVSSKKRIEFYKKLISKLEIKKTQVYVRAKIIEVNDEEVNNTGIKYGIFAGSSKRGNVLTLSSSLNNSSAFAFEPSLIGLNIPNITKGLALGVTLNLLKQNYALDVISQPSLLCLNNTSSSIYVGETISVLTGSTTNSSGTSNSYVREDIGLKLSVKPRILNNKLMLNIKASIEGVKTTQTISGNADTSKKEIITRAIVNNGESIIIGGLIEQRNEKTKVAIPFFSKIPIIGNAFKNASQKKSISNLMIIVTPYIVPQNKNLSYLIDELAKLELLEDKYLQKILNKFEKKEKKVKKNEYSQIHKRHLEIIYGKN